MGKGFAKKKKQARMFQEKLTELQEQMQQTEMVGQSGNGLVQITLNGDYEMKGILIKPDCVDKEDVEGLQDLIKAAYNDACEKLKKQTPEIPSLGGGMPNFNQFF
jgi:DNA-binding YbaB/EbfC family protein